ncbi:MAG: hypothetical protein A2939_05385 [Parcubacteria group bacterium RIFCSPLOWO2_01_FULL_48_18]|nr:MAG: hypothetical protein A3J67_06585 [Parcubacteria group bacterium RIFCSPHIGHO2_02_FULL_48_10b]OHB22530.1 MAG: hypothetical protein A2939_05385 [Parcubacteria group bacterium RIFCSPLOWO2_01_FULL_48_18]
MAETTLEQNYIDTEGAEGAGASDDIPQDEEGGSAGNEAQAARMPFGFAETLIVALFLTIIPDILDLVSTAALATVIAAIITFALVIVDFLTGMGMNIYLIMKLGGLKARVAKTLAKKLVPWIVAWIIDMFVSGVEVLPLRTITFLVIAVLSNLEAKTGIGQRALTAQGIKTFRAKGIKP